MPGVHGALLLVSSIRPFGLVSTRSWCQTRRRNSANSRCTRACVAYTGRESGRLPSECSAGPGEAHIDWSGPYLRVDPGIVKGGGGGGDMVPYKATENFGLYVQFPAIWEQNIAIVDLLRGVYCAHTRVYEISSTCI